MPRAVGWHLASDNCSKDCMCRAPDLSLPSLVLCQEKLDSLGESLRTRNCTKQARGVLFESFGFGPPGLVRSLCGCRVELNRCSFPAERSCFQPVLLSFRKSPVIAEDGGRGHRARLLHGGLGPGPEAAGQRSGLGEARERGEVPGAGL